MSKDVINIHGDDVVVREDTAKAFRGIHWAIWSVGAFVLIAALLFVISYFSGTARNRSVDEPSTQSSNTR